jgi:amino-acid N-acetyltransferase
MRTPSKTPRAIPAREARIAIVTGTVPPRRAPTLTVGPRTSGRGHTRLRTARARLRDLAALERFIADYTSDGTLLPRTRANLLQHVRDFRVVWDGDRLVACGALQLVSESLSEIRSVAVDPAWRGAGLGSQVVRALLRDARALGIPRVFCLTRRVSFFARHGFIVVPMEMFPHKVWNDCRFCPRQECCDEIAMERSLR